MNIVSEYLFKKFKEVEPLDFYRNIFLPGSLDVLNEYNKNKYTGIVIEITKSLKKNGKQLIKRYSVTDDLKVIKELQSSNNFCVLAPISYIGKSRNSINARELYALTIELDNLIVDKKDGSLSGLMNLIYQWSTTYALPVPTYIVSSGNGVHLYYLFDEPIKLYKNVVKELQKYRKRLTRLIWNRYTTISYNEKDIQYESLFQGFRMVGTITKNGDRVQAFLVGLRVNMEYMNSFVDDKFKVKFTHESKFSLEQAREKYPEWYENRIINKKFKNTWTCKRDLYDWWKRCIETEANLGHRYYCLMILCIYALKCNISQSEVEKDALSLLDIFKAQDNLNNPFTEKDVVDALQVYENKQLITYPINSIINRSGIPIKKNKRNFRKQELHLRGARAIQDINDINGEWRNKKGRPSGSSTKKEIIQKWRKNNPNGRKVDCIKSTGLSKPTVYKWWEL